MQRIFCLSGSATSSGAYPPHAETQVRTRCRCSIERARDVDALFAHIERSHVRPLLGLTAFAPDARSFVALKLLARAFAIAEVMLADVVIAEELDPQHRGSGIGGLGALSSCGHGLALLGPSLVDVLPFGWRVLYLLGLPPLIVLAWLRR